MFTQTETVQSFYNEMETFLISIYHLYKNTALNRNTHLRKQIYEFL